MLKFGNGMLKLGCGMLKFGGGMLKFGGGMLKFGGGMLKFGNGMLKFGNGMENHVGERTVNIFGKVFPRDAFICRLYYLAFFASFGSLFPLLAVYFKQLGMTAAQAGILIGARPIVEFLSGPFWSQFASRFRKQKLLLLFSLGSLVIFTLAVGLVQPVTPYCIVYVPAIVEKIIDLSSFDSEEDSIAGIAPEYITRDRVCNYNEDNYGILVSPPHSTRVYRQPAVEQAFMLLLILICLGEFFSSPALPLADAATLHAVRDNPSEFGKIRLMASVGWGLAMFVMGVGLDYSDTFRNHPCPAENTTEKNYTLCFVMCTIFLLAAMGLASKFKFDDDAPAPGDVHGLVMDTRETEVSHVVAEKARARVTQSESGSDNSLWMALKALASMHILLFFVSVVVMGGGAGLVFSFLYWHLQDIGGSPVLFGILSVVNHASEIITYFYAFKLINKYGHVRVMYLCLAVNVFRFLALSVLDNPWMVLPLQVLQGACLATVWSCASSYISLVAPPHAKQHAQYALQVGYHGLGKGIGSIVGGSVISMIGSRTTFVLYALICLVTCAGSFGLNKLFKYEGIKYGAGNFEEEDMDIMAPQGVPMARDGKITDAFNTTTVVNANYGAIVQEDPTQDAYDRYVSTTR
uniref:MFS_1_like domain-containing protein n=1 Tax=Caenorhabditis japonica TaxID=281687 RepID=A0A8R1DSN3_CAEJA